MIDLRTFEAQIDGKTAKITLGTKPFFVLCSLFGLGLLCLVSGCSPGALAAGLGAGPNLLRPNVTNSAYFPASSPRSETDRLRDSLQADEIDRLRDEIEAERIREADEDRRRLREELDELQDSIDDRLDALERSEGSYSNGNGRVSRSAETLNPFD